MRTLKTMEPYRLNIAESVQSAHTLFPLFIYYYIQSTITFFYSFLFLQLSRFIYLLLLLLLLFCHYLVIIYNQFTGNACAKLRVEAKCQLCLKWAIGTPDNDVVLVSFLLVWNVFCAHYGASAVDFEQVNSVLIQFVSPRTFNYYYFCW